MEKFDLSGKHDETMLLKFADFINDIQRQVGFKVSARGWAYILEQERLINKDEFDTVERVINKCRKQGILPVDFVAEEDSRTFKEVHEKTEVSFSEHVEEWLQAALDCEQFYHPDWWIGEEYYIQMLVEKVDLVTLFRPICKKFHIPIGNARGWSSIIQRADYASRFKAAEKRGLKCVLLYCGDHDPDGLRISDQLMKNLRDVKEILWSNGSVGYNPIDLEINRFGLDYKFIIDHDLTWIDNLITGSKKNLADPKHRNHNMPYLQEYLGTVGERKCEANALVTIPELGKKLCEDTIISYLGKDAEQRLINKKEVVEQEVIDLMNDLDITEQLQESIKLLNQ